MYLVTTYSFPPHTMSGAYESGHVAVMKTLVDAGADIEEADRQGSTPLHKAAFGKHAKAVRALIELGANVNSRDVDGGTPLFR